MSRGRAKRAWQVWPDPLVASAQIHRARTASGMQVWVAPRRGWSERFALVATRYGAQHRTLPDGTPLPVGIAHLLEHQMFQSEQGDLFDAHAARGASANAYTTGSHTAYLVTYRTQGRATLRTLLEGVRTFHSTPEALARERRIVEQEIAMYRDDPGWRGWQGLVQALYVNHSVRDDVAGTSASIGRIDLPLLARVHAAYYRPSNMVLAVAGDVRPAEVLELAAACFPGRPHARPPGPETEEPATARRRHASLRLPVSRPQVLWGIKLPPARTAAATRRDRANDEVLASVLFGDGGWIQSPLFDAGWVDEGFGAIVEVERSYAHVAAGGDVDDVRAFKRAFRATWRRACAKAPASADVERARRRLLGRGMRAGERPQGVAHAMLRWGLEGEAPGQGVDALAQVTPRSARARLRVWRDAPEAWSVIRPR